MGLFMVTSLIVGLLVVVGLIVGIIYVIANVFGFAIGLLPNGIIVGVFVIWILPMILKDIGRHIGKGIAESTKDKE